MFDGYKYVPLLGLKPAEMRAVQELPKSTVSSFLPIVDIKPWLSALKLENSLEILDRVMGGQKVAVGVHDSFNVAAAPRPVYDQLRELMVPDGGYNNWVDFISKHKNFIPCLQIGDQENFILQYEKLRALNRGVVLKLSHFEFGFVEKFASLFNLESANNDIMIVIDYGQHDDDAILEKAAQAIGWARYIIEHIPHARIAFASTSFPSSFRERTMQEIYERRFFAECARNINEPVLLFSDHGGVNSNRNRGGGGAVPPRVDYARQDTWFFSRREVETKEERPDAYVEAASEIRNSDFWDDKLSLWGTQMIARTALGDPDAITSPSRATAVRVNIHLHLQTFYEAAPEMIYDTDEDWVE